MRTTHTCKDAVAVTSYQIALSRIMRGKRFAYVAQVLLAKYNVLYKRAESAAYSDDADDKRRALLAFEAKLDNVIPSLETLASESGF